MDITPTPKVYGAIVAVITELGRDGITKSRKNQQQGYNFRGIDEVYNALNGALSRAGLVMLPRILTRVAEERATKSGGSLTYVVVEAEFDLIAMSDGSCHTIRAFGEAMDSADKATNKAMSAAFKYAAMQAFCIPTEGDNDADAHTPEPAPKPAPRRDAAPKPTAEHDASWTPNASAAFCATVGDLGFKYDQVAEWCQSLGRPRPSQMDGEARKKLIDHLRTDAGKLALGRFLVPLASK